MQADELKTKSDGRVHAAGALLHVRPMDAVAALYSEGDAELSDALITSLGRSLFGKGEISPAGPLQCMVARLTCGLLKWTTRRHDGDPDSGQPAGFRNRLLERSKHPYADSLLASSRKETEALVEGGDPMNGPYMMLSPEIRKACTLWDKLFFNTVQGRDVQMRLIWETEATYEVASRRLERGHPVVMKALAAGTGLSMILAYDRLLRDGHDPAMISACITDREPANTEKTGRLLCKLAARRGWRLGSAGGGGISCQTEDIFDEEAAALNGSYDVVTAIGILEYLQGHTCDTTERRHGLHEPDEPATALHLAEKLGAMTAIDASLIVNTYRPHASTRILEIFGKRFDYRDPVNLASLLATANFKPARVVGSGVIYDVKVYERISPEGQ